MGGGLRVVLTGWSPWRRSRVTRALVLMGRVCRRDWATGWSPCSGSRVTRALVPMGRVCRRDWAMEPGPVDQFPGLGGDIPSVDAFPQPGWTRRRRRPERFRSARYCHSRGWPATVHKTLTGCPCPRTRRLVSSTRSPNHWRHSPPSVADSQLGLPGLESVPSQLAGTELNPAMPMMPFMPMSPMGGGSGPQHGELVAPDAAGLLGGEAVPWLDGVVPQAVGSEFGTAAGGEGLAPMMPFMPMSPMGGGSGLQHGEVVAPDAAGLLGGEAVPWLDGVVPQAVGSEFGTAAGGEGLAPMMPFMPMSPMGAGSGSQHGEVVAPDAAGLLGGQTEPWLDGVVPQAVGSEFGTAPGGEGLVPMMPMMPFLPMGAGAGNERGEVVAPDAAGLLVVRRMPGWMRMRPPRSRRPMTGRPRTSARGSHTSRPTGFRWGRRRNPSQVIPRPGSRERSCRCCPSCLRAGREIDPPMWITPIPTAAPKRSRGRAGTPPAHRTG